MQFYIATYTSLQSCVIYLISCKLFLLPTSPTPLYPFKHAWYSLFLQLVRFSISFCVKLKWNCKYWKCNKLICLYTGLHWKSVFLLNGPYCNYILLATEYRGVYKTPQQTVEWRQNMWPDLQKKRSSTYIQFHEFVGP